MTSARSLSRYCAIAGTRLGELASSSPSRMTRTFQAGLPPELLIASSAAQSATIGALSSDADRAYRRHSGSNLAMLLAFGDLLAAAIDARGAKNRRERVGLSPGLRVYGLAVVVAVEEERRGCTRHLQIAVDERVAGGLEDIRRKAPRREHAAKVFGIATDVGPIRSDVRDRQQVDQLVNQRLLMLDHPLPHRPTHDGL